MLPGLYHLQGNAPFYYSFQMETFLRQMGSYLQWVIMHLLSSCLYYCETSENYGLWILTPCRCGEALLFGIPKAVWRTQKVRILSSVQFLRRLDACLQSCTMCFLYLLVENGLLELRQSSSTFCTFSLHLFYITVNFDSFHVFCGNWPKLFLRFV